MKKLVISLLALLFFSAATPALAQSSLNHAQLLSVLEKLAKLPPVPSTGLMVTIVDAEPPVIKSVTGPAELEVGENGHWWIRVADPSASPLIYGVRWGDNGAAIQQTKLPSYIPDVAYQVIVFNHTYQEAGVYQIMVLVTDQSGQKSEQEVSVEVI